MNNFDGTYTSSNMDCPNFNMDVIKEALKVIENLEKESKTFWYIASDYIPKRNEKNEVMLMQLNNKNILLLNRTEAPEIIRKIRKAGLYMKNYRKCKDIVHPEWSLSDFIRHNPSYLKPDINGLIGSENIP